MTSNIVEVCLEAFERRAHAQLQTLQVVQVLLEDPELFSRLQIAGSCLSLSAG